MIKTGLARLTVVGCVTTDSKPTHDKGLNAEQISISRAGQEAPPFLAAQAAENEAIRKPRFRIAC
ncbi:hypothetical protein F2Q65_13585 [Thiohalocapsa marina]|uniref:Uncharacterized protein n=1 Tax=Thiohalocapsa marina TaxID=424902 RepID=A0A5M8FHB7_9GAMM|nr:hypothetical protein [Thiohalocapsa marina]KAA6184099.1 hypothetical protein F2Q65_13585 [Thiohalocapsa marina]